MHSCPFVVQGFSQVIPPSGGLLSKYFLLKETGIGGGHPFDD
jgi:hypothetical protein